MGKENGRIHINSKESASFRAHINNQEYPFLNGLWIEDLKPDFYELCITNDSDDSFNQCFEVRILEGMNIDAEIALRKNSEGGSATISVFSGTKPYIVKINDVTVLETEKPKVTLPVNHNDELIVETGKSCEGQLYKKVVLSTDISLYPNPASERVTLVSQDLELQVLQVHFYNAQGQLLVSNKYKLVDGKATIDLSEWPTGIYIAQIISPERLQTVKISKI